MLKRKTDIMKTTMINYGFRPMMTKWILMLGILAVSISPAGFAYADSLSITDLGSVYTLSYSGSPISSTTTTQTFDITLMVNTAGYNGTGYLTGTAFLDAAAIKVSPTITSASLVSAPSGFNYYTGYTNASGCTGLSTTGAACAGYGSLSTTPVPNGTYTFEWNITVPTGTLFAGLNGSTIKTLYLYTNPANNKLSVSGQTSVTVPYPVPEPSSLLLLGSGLILAGMVVWRRRQLSASNH